MKFWNNSPSHSKWFHFPIMEMKFHQTVAIDSLQVNEWNHWKKMFSSNNDSIETMDWMMKWNWKFTPRAPIWKCSELKWRVHLRSGDKALARTSFKTGRFSKILENSTQSISVNNTVSYFQLLLQPFTNFNFTIILKRSWSIPKVPTFRWGTWRITTFGGQIRSQGVSTLFKNPKEMPDLS